MNRLLLCLLLSFSVICQGQNSNQQERLEKMETDFAIIKDFLNVQLKDLSKKLKKKDILFAKLQKSNRSLSKKVKRLENLMAELETKILHLKIEKPMPQTVKNVEKNTTQEKETYKSKKIRKIAKEFESNNEDLRMAAIIKLNKIKNHPEANKLYKIALKDKSVYVKIVACKGLATKKDLKIAIHLLNLLQDNNIIVRKNANKALEKITNATVGFNPKQPENDKIMEWENKIKNEKSK